MRNVFLDALVQIILRLATVDFIAETIVLLGRKLAAMTRTDLDDRFVELVARALKVPPSQIAKNLTVKAV